MTQNFRTRMIQKALREKLERKIVRKGLDGENEPLGRHTANEDSRSQESGKDDEIGRS